LKPNEFYEMQPCDFLIMKSGFELRQEYEFGLHVQTLSVLRHIGYTVYATAPKKKGQKNDSIEKYLPLEMIDKKRNKTKPATADDFERIKKLHSKKFK